MGFFTALIVVVALVGVGILLYPTASDFWNNLQQVNAISNYDRMVKETDSREFDAIFTAAEDYNAKLAQYGLHTKLTDEETKTYESLLNVGEGGMMGVIDIPKIDVMLPIYHGTSEDVLAEAVGHLAGTSLPVGGTGTHCCLSAHRGYPSARLFTDLTSMREGDRFVITVLNRTLTYEVDDVREVLPQEADSLVIDPAQDYVTLITCTPYGINTHRLLVRGKRVANDPEEIRMLADAVQIQTSFVAMAIGALVITGALVWIGLYIRRRMHERLALEKTEQAFRRRREERKNRKQ